MSKLGLKRGTVRLTSYDSVWASEFDKEKRLLQAAIGKYASDFQHVGSTAVPDLPAKPIIDIIAIVQDLDIYNEMIKPLEKLGYEFMPERVFEDRVFFPKGPRHNRTHHLSLVTSDSQIYRDNVLFRDYLRSNPSARQKYGKAKIELAKKFPNDRYAYTAAKDKIINQILDEAKNV